MDITTLTVAFKASDIRHSNDDDVIRAGLGGFSPVADVTRGPEGEFAWDLQRSGIIHDTVTGLGSDEIVGLGGGGGVWSPVEMKQAGVDGLSPVAEDRDYDSPAAFIVLEPAA